MKRYATALAAIAVSSLAVAACSTSAQPVPTERLRMHDLASAVFGNERTIRVWLPDEYLDPPEPDPRGSQYAAFLRDEVFPLIDGTYRTRPDARVLSGSSYGTLVMLFVAATAPDLAGGLLIESPSLYVNDGAIFDDLERADLSLERVYIGIGTNELDEPDCGQSADNDEAVEDASELGELLERKLGDGGRIHLNVEPCAIHDEAAWAARFPEALRFLFPR